MFSLALFAGVIPLAAQTAPSGPGTETASPDGQAVSPGAESAAPGERSGPPQTSAPDESAILLGEDPAVPAPESGSSVLVLLRMVLVLALAALAIYGVIFFIKRLARPQEVRDPHLKVLARVPLSNDSFAAVVSVGAKAWLVGGGGGSVNLISEISDPEPLEAMLLDDARKTAEAGTRRYFDFRSLLRKERPVPRTGGEAETDGTSPRFGAVPEGVERPLNSRAEALRKQRERLEGL